MKRVLNISFLFALALTFVIACQKDDAPSQMTKDNLEKALKIDLAEKQTHDIISASYNMQDKSVQTKFSECVQTTVNIDGLTTFVSLDFGDGCEMPDGNIVKGKLSFSYFLADNFTTHVDYEYESFSTYGLDLNGSGSYDFTLKNTNDNPETSATFDFSATLDGESIHKKGTFVSEWSQGFDTLDWDDNIITVTGNWDTTFANGDIYHSDITTALEATDCLYFVKGQINVRFNDDYGILDFGNGLCDNEVTYTNDEGDVISINI